MSSRRAIIVTLLHNSQNYGGILQAFSLCKVMSDLGWDTVQLDYLKKSTGKKESVSKNYIGRHGYWAFLHKSINSIKKKRFAKANKKEYISLFQSRKKAIENFINENIPHTVVCTKEDVYKLPAYDAYLCGSDQIWKPTVIDEVYALQFGVQSAPHISYAASISVETLSDEQKKLYRKWIPALSAVSVREEHDCHLLEPLVPQTVNWTCDPVFLIDSRDWRRLSEQGRVKEKYIFCYFLGDDKKHRMAAQAYAKSRGLKIVTLPNMQGIPRSVDADFGDYKLYDVSPLEFVGLIDCAQAVFTDSFHATAFSLILHTVFYVFERNAIISMNSRITSILTLTETMERFILPTKEAIQVEKEIDWDKVDMQLCTYREKSMSYLIENLKKV